MSDDWATDPDGVIERRQAAGADPRPYGCAALLGFIVTWLMIAGSVGGLVYLAVR